MAAKGLRSVKPGETAEVVKPKTVTEAASTGTRLELLVAMRDRVASAVESPATLPRDLAALTKRLTDLMSEIEVLKAANDAESERGAAKDEAFDASAI